MWQTQKYRNTELSLHPCGGCTLTAELSMPLHQSPPRGRTFNGKGLKTGTSWVKQTQHREVTVVYCLLLTGWSSEKPKQTRNAFPTPTLFHPLQQSGTGQWGLQSLHNASSLPSSQCHPAPADHTWHVSCVCIQE